MEEWVLARQIGFHRFREGFPRPYSPQYPKWQPYFPKNIAKLPY
jgi:hypothetical protein